MANIEIERDLLGNTADGMPVDRYTLRNKHGVMVRIITYGASVSEARERMPRNRTPT